MGHYRETGQHAETDRQHGKILDRAPVGLPGEPEAVGKGAEELARQRLSDEELRISGGRVKGLRHKGLNA